jgi:hypothetical protein
MLPTNYIRGLKQPPIIKMKQLTIKEKDTKGGWRPREVIR